MDLIQVPIHSMELGHAKNSTKKLISAAFGWVFPKLVTIVTRITGLDVF